MKCEKCGKHQTDAICEYRTQDGQCLKHSDDVVRSFCVDGPCPDETHSNADRIRALNDDELAEFLADFENGVIEWEQGFCDLCMQQANAEQRKVDCMDCLKKWLQQPAKDGD